MFERGWCKVDREIWFRAFLVEGLGDINLVEFFFDFFLLDYLYLLVNALGV